MTAFNAPRSDGTAFNVEADGTPFRVPDGVMFDATEETQAAEGVTGALAAQVATASGAIETAAAITGQGTAEPDDGSLSGAMDVTPVHEASGDLAAEAADVSGAIEILPEVAAGDLAAQDAAMTGNIDVVRDFSDVPVDETFEVTFSTTEEVTVAFSQQEVVTVRW